MRLSLCVFALIFLLSTAFQQNNFKEQQLKYQRVKEAFTEKEDLLNKMLIAKYLKREKLQLLVRVFKKEAELEVWAKNKEDAKFQLLKTYDICSSSGTVGPKRKEGDLQVPEGFYHINVFNPASNFHLSLGINYPNASDKILSDKKRPGGSIFIHGDCVTIGCMPLTDTKIKEVYALCVEARNNGQMQIPVHIFPCKMEGDVFTKLKSTYASDTTLISFWNNLETGYTYVKDHKKLPVITVDKKGKYQFK